MKYYKFSCSKCEQHLECEEQFCGRQVQCPNCNHVINVPPARGKTALYPLETGRTWTTFFPGGIVRLTSKPPTDEPNKDTPLPRKRKGRA